MAMAVTVYNDLTEAGNKTLKIRGKLVFSGSYATGGETFNFTTIPGCNVKKDAVALVSVWGCGGYGYGWAPGGTLAVGKVKISTTAAAELTAGAYPAGVTSDTVFFEVCIPKH